MKSPDQILLSWSSGKDSAWALHLLRQQKDVEVVGLLTTVNRVYDRVAMHAVRRSLLEAQAQATGLTLWPVYIPSPCTNEDYEAAMSDVMAKAKQEGIDAVAFGDLYLEDIRRYREEKMAGTGISPLFPVWELPTDQLAQDMIQAGVRAHLTCVDPKQLDPSFAGRTYDASLLADLPDSVDPCGENGEFHTFVCSGIRFPRTENFIRSMFRHPIPVVAGECVERDGFMFSDLMLKE